MWWLWILGPVLVGVIYLLTARADRRQLREVELWRGTWGPIRGGKALGAKRVGALPAELAALAREVGAGKPLATFELVPTMAYLGVYAPSVASSTEHQTVVARLADAAPAFVARPLPLLDGERVANTGVIFHKDPEFSAAYLVEADDAKGVKIWLSPPVREQLCEAPDLWLRARGRVMAVTRYGRPDADRMDELLAAADVIFAEYGAVEASLLGDDLVFEPERKTKTKGKDKKKAQGIVRADATPSKSVKSSKV
jgi:hypothetical protein